MPQPTTNNLEGLAYKYANDNGSFHTENPVSLKTEMIERELKQLISDLRKHDEEELIKMLPEPREVYHNKGSEEFESAYAYNSALDEVKQLIKDYYNK